MTTNIYDYWKDPFYNGATGTTVATTTTSDSYITRSGSTTTIELGSMVSDLVDRKLKGEDIKPKEKKQPKRIPKEFRIKQVIYNHDKKATTVLFKDGSCIVVKKSENGNKSDIYDVVAYAIAKKIYGYNSAFKRELKEKTTLIENKKKIKVDPDTLEV